MKVENGTPWKSTSMAVGISDFCDSCRVRRALGEIVECVCGCLNLAECERGFLLRGFFALDEVAAVVGFT